MLRAAAAVWLAALATTTLAFLLTVGIQAVGRLARSLRTGGPSSPVARREAAAQALTGRAEQGSIA